MAFEGLRALVAQWRAEVQARGGCSCFCCDTKSQCADQLEKAVASFEASLLAMRPDAHRHLPIEQSYEILAGLFADVAESHSILSRRGHVLGDRLPDRISRLCARVEAGDGDRRAMAAVRAAVRSCETSSSEAPQQIAERIVDDLFANGQGQTAARLVLTASDGRDLGGWSRLPARDRIVDVLRKGV